VLREHHSDIAISLHNLRASMLSKREKFDEAEELHRQEIALDQTNMKKMTSKSDLARSLARRDRYDKADH